MVGASPANTHHKVWLESLLYAFKQTVCERYDRNCHKNAEVKRVSVGKDKGTSLRSQTKLLSISLICRVSIA